MLKLISLIAGAIFGAAFFGTAGYYLVADLDEVYRFVILLVALVLAIILAFAYFVIKLTMQKNHKTNEIAQNNDYYEISDKPSRDDNLLELRYPINRKISQNIPERAPIATKPATIPYRMRDGAELQVKREMIEHLLAQPKITRAGWRWENTKYTDAKRILTEHYGALDSAGFWVSDEARELVREDIYS